jgi:hypothetical protein
MRPCQDGMIVMTKLAVATIVIVSLPFLVGAALDWLFKPSVRCADWKGALQRRFVLARFRFEWGRWCYQTDCCGQTRASWWERAVQE